MLIEASLVSLDGVVEAPWEWTGDLFDEESKRHSLAQLERADLFLLGRVTYEAFVATGPKIEGEPYFDRINAMRKLVVSTTLRNPGWNAAVLDRDVAERLAELKRQPGGDIVKYGNGALTRTLLAHRLIDELHLSIVPVVVGRGRHLFDGIDVGGLGFSLAGTHASASGIVTLTYVPR
jgi:dihydrofolate reductase